MIQKLLFIYNANSGTVNASLDVLHKALSPSTYNCNLCRITHGVLKENDTWKAFRKSSDLNMEFLHIDEFQKQYKSKFGHKFSFPVVLAGTQNGLEIFIAPAELNAVQGPEALIELVKERAGLFK